MDFAFDNSRKPIAQGDMYLVPIMAIPETAKASPIKPENGHYILTHSETGHHHVVMERSTVRMYKGPDAFRAFFEVDEVADPDAQPVELEHLREHHRHEPQVISPGAWLIQRQAQYTPQGWQRAQD